MDLVAFLMVPANLGVAAFTARRFAISGDANELAWSVWCFGAAVVGAIWTAVPA